MLQKHKKIFYDIADLYNCWIGLREPNPLAEQWIGRPGFIPKMVSCKAKTSDNQNFRFAGLVTDPLLCPEAFKTSSLGVAIEKWNKWTHGKGKTLPGGFRRPETGPEKGLVKYDGKAIHADFDLMFICLADEDGKMIYTDYKDAERLFHAVQHKLNHRLGSPMIQHGAEFTFKDGVGAAESEQVLTFGPKRKFMQVASSMPTKPGAMH